MKDSLRKSIFKLWEIRSQYSHASPGANVNAQDFRLYTETLSYAEMAAKIGEAIGRKLRFEAISPEDERAGMAKWEPSEEVIEAHISIYRSIREGQMAELSDGVRRVLGRAPISFDQWARENARAFSE